MLAQNFKTAEDLRIPETHRQALMKTLVLLETGKLTYAEYTGPFNCPTGKFTGHFNMGHWRDATDCGSVCCVGGTAEIIGGVRFGGLGLGDALHDLFLCGLLPCGGTGEDYAPHRPRPSRSRPSLLPDNRRSELERSAGGGSGVSETPFSVGDVVYLKSGSAPLTITLFVPDGNIRVTWMDSGAIKSSQFPRAALTSRKPRYGERAAKTAEGFEPIQIDGSES